MDYTHPWYLRFKTRTFASILVIGGLAACGDGSTPSPQDGGTRVDSPSSDERDAFTAPEIDAHTTPGTDDGGLTNGDDAFAPSDAGAPRTDAFVPMGADGGGRCISNEQCASTDWCAGASCEEAGVCMPRPESCPDVIRPVCGCDGNTYSNECYAAREGVRVVREGPCEPVGRPCFSNSDCSEREFCSGEACDGPGRCIPRPESCITLYDPVCGCDGRTYGNACNAAGAGVRVAYPGECSDGGETMCRPPCRTGETCQRCRGVGGLTWVCLPEGTAC